MAICYNKGWASSPNFMTRQEAQAVTSLADSFKGSAIVTFDEFKYFTGVTALSGLEFNNCKQLVSIAVPSSINSITVNYTFGSCPKLKTITWNSQNALIGDTRPSPGVIEYKTENPNLMAVNGCLYSADGTILYGVPPALASFSWRGTEVEIKTGAFYASIIAGAIVFPHSVTTIGGILFYDSCKNITSIDLSNTQITVLPQMVRCVKNSALSSYILPPGLVKTTGGDPIGSRANTQVTSLTFPATLERVEGGNWFANGYTSLTFLGTTPPYFAAAQSAGSLTAIYVPAGSVDAYKATSRLSAVSSLIQAIPSA